MTPIWFQKAVHRLYIRVCYGKRCDTYDRLDFPDIEHPTHDCPYCQCGRCAKCAAWDEYGAVWED